MFNNNKRILLIVVSSIISCLVLFLALIWFFLFTENGSAFISQRFMEFVQDKKGTVWQENEGTLMSGMEYTDIELENIKWFPFPNKLKIQALIINIDSFGLDGVSLKIVNGRFYLPDSEPILFHGNLENKLADFNFYTNTFSDRELKSLINTINLQGVAGNLADIDVFIKGPIRELLLTGKFSIDKLQKQVFVLERAPCEFDLKIKKVFGKLRLYGPLTFKSGVISGQKTALLRLQESKIVFDGDPLQPNFDIKATSKVEKVRIAIKLKGNFKEPDLQISSTPSLPRDRLLLALATNRTWQGSEELMSKGSISPNLAKDVLDYFVFGGQSGKFAEKLGIKDIYFKYDDQGKGVTVTKDLSSRLEGRYEIEEKKENGSQANVSHKVGGEYKITDTISLDANKELEQKGASTHRGNKESEEEVMLKFKISF